MSFKRKPAAADRMTIYEAVNIKLTLCLAYCVFRLFYIMERTETVNRSLF